MHTEIALSVQNSGEQATGGRLIALVVDSVTSEYSRRSYRTGLVRFFGWRRTSRCGANLLEGAAWRVPGCAARWRAVSCHGQSRLAPVRRLAREMADNGLLDPAVAAAVGRVTVVARHGTRDGCGRD